MVRFAGRKKISVPEGSNVVLHMKKGRYCRHRATR
jgi:hypothetical protein